MKHKFRTVIISAWLSSAFAVLPAMNPARADNVLATESTDLVANTRSCANGQIPDHSTAEQAKQRVEAVGYTDVHILAKGCDNVWRATGVKGGTIRKLIISPDGGVMPGGN
jgi:hypothetical protein